MMMSVFRARSRRRELDHAACMAIATTGDDVELVSWAFLYGKLVLVGLDGHVSIIKPLEAGDDGLSFEALYDTCLTLRDYRRMRTHQAQTPEDLRPVLYRIGLVARIDQHPRAVFLLKARDEIAARERLTALVNEEDFRRQLALNLVEQMLTFDEVRLVSAGALKIADPAPEEAPEWEFLAHPDSD